MADDTAPLPAPPAAPQPDRWPIYVGVLVTLIWAALVFAVLFMPKAEAITDAIVQQILTAATGGWMLFLGWLWGSSASSAKKTDAIIGAK